MKFTLVAFIFILVVCIPAGFSNWGLTESSEARYAQISKEMFVSGNFIHPKLLGINHYHKPPVTYYITSLGYFIFGVNEYGARLFLSLALLFQLLLVFKIAQLLYKSRSLSLTATLIYFSYPIVQVATKNLTTDAYLTTFIFSSLYFFLKYHQSNRTVKYLYLFYIFCGLSFLTKGPVGILPQLFFAIFYVYALKIKVELKLKQLIPLLLGIAICISWFIVLLYQNENLLRYFIQYQLVDRVASDAFNRGKPFWYYMVTMPLLGLPTILFPFRYFVTKLGLIRTKRTVSTVLAITFILLLFVFSISSSKLVLYVLPLYLFVAILTAKYFFTISLSTQKLFESISIIFWCVLYVVLIALCFIPGSFVFPKVPILLLSFTGILSAVLFKYVNCKVNPIKISLINAICITVLVCIFPFVMRANDLKINSIKSVSRFISEKHKNQHIGSVIVFNYLLPSLSFYTNQNIITVDNGNPATKRETQFETGAGEWKKNYIRLNLNKDSLELDLLLAQPNSFLIEQHDRPLPDSLFFMKRKFNHKASMEQWTIYY